LLHNKTLKQVHRFPQLPNNVFQQRDHGSNCCTTLPACHAGFLVYGKNATDTDMSIRCSSVMLEHEEYLKKCTNVVLLNDYLYERLKIKGKVFLFIVYKYNECLFTFRTFINKYFRTSAYDREACHLLQQQTLFSLTSSADMWLQVTVYILFFLLLLTWHLAGLLVKVV
jgi:hypothetical protein